MFQVLALHHSLWQRADAWNISFQTLYGGQFTLSTHLIILYYPGYDKGQDKICGLMMSLTLINC